MEDHRSCACCGCAFHEIADNAEFAGSVATLRDVDPSTISFTAATGASAYSKSVAVVWQDESTITFEPKSRAIPLFAYLGQDNPGIGDDFDDWAWVPDDDGFDWGAAGITSFHSFAYTSPTSTAIRRVGRLQFDGESKLILPFSVTEANSPSGIDDQFASVSRHLPDKEVNQGVLTARTSTYVPAVGILSPTFSKSASSGAISIRGHFVTVFRDGEQVFSGSRANASTGDVIPETGEVGSYLVVVVDDHGFTSLASFTVFKTQPVFATTQLNDLYDGEQFGSLARSTIYRIATQPWLGQYDHDYVSPGVVAPRRRSVFDQGNFDPTLQSAVGDHTTYFFPQNQKDIFGNDPLYVAPLRYRNLAVPANNRRGSRPILRDPGYDTVPHFRPRSQSERVEYVDLTFDRKVKRETVTANQFTLTANGQDAGGVTIQELGDSGTRWRAFVPAGPQVERTFLVLTYDPSGTVTDDIAVITVGTAADLPLASQAAWKTLYVTADNGKKYSRSSSGMIEVAQYPVDQNGVPYAPEACLLASRVGWLMNGQPFPALIDTRNFQTRIGSTASILKSIPSGEFPKVFSTGEYVTNNLGNKFVGQYTEHDPPAFSPGVPSQSSWEDDCSYFGLETTISPCPPKTLGLCAVPRSAERHSSVIRSNGDITGFVLTPPEPPSPLIAYEIHGPGDNDPLAGFLAGELTFSKIANGEHLGQNIWVCDQQGGAQLTPERAEEFENLNPGEVAFNFQLQGNRAHAVLAATRRTTTYPGLETTYLQRLELVLILTVEMTETISHPGAPERDNPYHPEIPGKTWTFKRFVQQRVDFSLSASDEESLANGGDVELKFAYGENEESGWKIRATAG